MAELEYKIGDKVRMLEGYWGLKAGEEYTITDVSHEKDMRPYKIGNMWPTRSSYEHLPSEPNNDDLLNNTTPFGLLAPDVQDRMKAWEHGWDFWWTECREWVSVTEASFDDGIVYRCLPAPVKPKRITTWFNVYGDGRMHMGRATRDEADEHARNGRLAIYRIERNEDGSDPQIFVEDV